MSTWHLVSEQGRNLAAVAHCERQLHRAREDAVRAREVLRRASRSVQEAEDALGDATRRLRRIEVPVQKAG